MMMQNKRNTNIKGPTPFLEINLPSSEKYRPSKKNLAEHLERFAGNF